MKLLPIGSVVSLAGSSNLVMIYGHLQKDLNTDRIYDYIGCDYPLGIIDTDQCYLFQDEDIEKLAFVGLQDTESIDYQIAISKYLDESGLAGRDKS